MKTRNIIELRKRSHSGGYWEAYHLGPHAKRITELFGTPAIPTAFTASAPASKVKATIERLNPGVEVIIEDERLDAMEEAENMRLGI